MADVRPARRREVRVDEAGAARRRLPRAGPGPGSAARARSRRPRRGSGVDRERHEEEVGQAVRRKPTEEEVAAEPATRSRSGGSRRGRAPAAGELPRPRARRRGPGFVAWSLSQGNEGAQAGVVPMSAGIRRRPEGDEGDRQACRGAGRRGRGARGVPVGMPCAAHEQDDRPGVGEPGEGEREQVGPRPRAESLEASAAPSAVPLRSSRVSVGRRSRARRRRPTGT